MWVYLMRHGEWMSPLLDILTDGDSVQKWVLLLVKRVGEEDYFGLHFIFVCGYYYIEGK